MSTTTETLELMHRVIDGDATDVERAKLRAALSASAEMRANFEALQSLVTRLDNMPQVAPPGIAAEVMPRLHASPVRHMRPVRKAVMAAAWAAAAAIAIAFAIHRAAPPPQTAAATMVSLQVEEWPVVARATSAAAKVTVRANGDRFVVDAKAEGSGPFSIEWDGHLFTPSTGTATFVDRLKPARVELQRRAGSSGHTVVRLNLPEKESLTAAVDLP